MRKLIQKQSRHTVRFNVWKNILNKGVSLESKCGMMGEFRNLEGEDDLLTAVVLDEPIRVRTTKH